MLGFLAVVAAFAAAGFGLWRVAKGRVVGADGEGRALTLFKVVVFFGLVGALLAAKLWPLAFMTLLAAGAVTGIEIWRSRAIRGEERDAPPPVRSGPAMRREEAASVLGVSTTASADEIRAAHKRLIGRLHPDAGGTDYLAAQINAARETLLAGAGKPGAAPSDTGAGPAS